MRERARWVVGRSRVQHRSPGCRGLDGACRKTGNDLDEAVRRGLVREISARVALREGLSPCGYCFSAAGFRRSPHDFEMREA